MGKFGGTRYGSLWDGSTWLIVAIVAACCVIHLLIDRGVVAVVISVVMLSLFVVALRSIYYRIDGDKLVVYQFFIPTVYPIDKIKEVKPTKSMLSAPATSLSGRLAVTFTDKKILKSTIPLIISPEHRQEFIRQLLSVNPDIRHSC